jgi:hypothetical protein
MNYGTQLNGDSFVNGQPVKSKTGERKLAKGYFGLGRKVTQMEENRKQAEQAVQLSILLQYQLMQERFKIAEELNDIKRMKKDMAMDMLGQLPAMGGSPMGGGMPPLPPEAGGMQPLPQQGMEQPPPFMG